MDKPVPKALAAIAEGRDFIRTAEFGRAINKAPQTIRRIFCQTGQVYGIKPRKIGNELNWPVQEIADLLNGVTRKPSDLIAA